MISMLTGTVYNGELYVATFAFGTLWLYLMHVWGDDDVVTKICAVISFIVAVTGLFASVALAAGYIEFYEIAPAGSGGRIVLDMMWMVNVAMAAAIGYLLITNRNTAPIPIDDPPN